MNHAAKAMQLVATTLLAASGLLHLATFFVDVPGFAIVGLVLLILAVVVAVCSFFSLYHFCYFRSCSIPYQSWGFALISEVSQRKSDAESEVRSHITPKWSTLIGSAAGYLFLNGMFCLLLFAALAPRPQNKTAEAQTQTSRLADRYAGRFFSGCALLPATLTIVAMHVILPELLRDSERKDLQGQESKLDFGEPTPPGK